jgi:hypothetical protein
MGLSAGEMAKVPPDSLRRRPPGKSRPGGALTLLKAYGSFQKACCLFLQEERYYSYASAGSDMEAIAIPKDDLYFPEKEGAYHSINLQFGAAEDALDSAWILPLSKGWEYILLFIEEPSFEPDPAAVSRVISAVPEAFIPSPGKRPGLLKMVQKKRETLPPQGDDIQKEIQKFYGSYASIQGIILELPALPGDEDFSSQVNRIVSALGTAMALPSPRRCLVLFSNAIDRDLLAHRLCKSLKVRALAVFMADNVQAVSDIIRPYL